MKADVYGIDGKKGSSINLPKQFTESIRPDIIKKANEVIEGNLRQRAGAFVGAGIRAAAELSRRRKKIKSSYGRGISRVPRKFLWKRGTQFAYVGAFAPGTVSGRRAHPAKAAKDFSQKINKTERRLAIRSAISSTIIPDIVKARGHRFSELISVIDTKAEAISKTKDVAALLTNLNLSEEMKRVSKRKIRAGRGTMRNRKYRAKRGPLFVVSKQCPLFDATSNLLGVDICTVNNLNVMVLAPGGNPGRLTLFTQEAINIMEKENLFYKSISKKVTKKTVKKVVKKVTKKTVKKVVKKVTKAIKEVKQ
jgi:large subunit ribosomal protein L4e